MLEIFEAVMRCQTTVGAAADLGISQPAVSNGLGALERQLGFTLFERANRQLKPTEDARLFLAEVEPLFSLLRNIETEARDLRAARAGRCGSGRRRRSAMRRCRRCCRPFWKAGPTSRCVIRCAVSTRFLQAVQTGAADVGFVLGLYHHPELDVIELAQSSMVCVLPAGHELADLEVVTPADLAGFPLIALETLIGNEVRAAFQSAGVPYSAKVEVRYCHTACILAGAGIGASIVDPYSAYFSSNLNLVIRPFLPDTKVVASATIRRGRSLPGVTADFIDRVKIELGQAGFG